MALTCASMLACARSSMTGPISTASCAGAPMWISAIAPLSISTNRSATSSCTQSTRRAEQRWPAASKAEAMASVTTCSSRAEESTTMQFWPPVSAINGTGRPCAFSRSASAACTTRAVLVEPVNITPCTRLSRTSCMPTSLPRPGSSCTAPRGTPACHKA